MTQTRRKTPSLLAVHRYAAGLTQQGLAERASVTRGTVARLESGEHRPRLLTARMIAAVLGVEAEHLFPETPEDENAPAAANGEGAKNGEAAPPDES